MDVPTPPVSAGARLGTYRLLRKIAEGGMGAVWEAEQESPRRLVALKVIRPDLSSPALLRRFEHESQVLGRLQHPSIAQIYEAGSAETAAGVQPFFAMELVHGRLLTEHVFAADLDTRARIGLLRKVADGVHHAHQKGVIHRDLKPANVLVTESGEPKIVDFGVARVTDAEARATLQTDVGQLLGTVPYMSPEQVAADPLELDTRSDVYALGVMLYEVLTGRLPYEVTGKALHEAVRVIREVEPTPMASTHARLRGDLETVVGKALEKDRERRYASAAELSEDLRRFLADEPIVARPPSAGYQLRKLARRHRALVLGIAAVLVALVGGVVAATSEAVRANRAERLAEQRATTEKAAREEAGRERTAALAAQAEAEAARVRAEAAREEALAAQRAAEAARGEAEAARAAESAARADAEASAADARAKAETSELVSAFFRQMLEAATPDVARGRELTVREIVDDSAARLEAGGITDNPLVEADVRRTLGRTYLALGDGIEAQRHLEAALALRRAAGAAPLEIARSEHDLGRALLTNNDFDTAARHLERALELGEAADADAGMRVGTLGQLAYLRYNQGRAEESMALRERALELARTGDTAPDAVLNALVSMAFQLHEARRYAEAEPLLREALEIWEREDELDDPDRSSTLTTLAKCLWLRQAYGEAEDAFTEAIDLARRVLPEGHPEIADVLVAYGAFLSDRRRYAEAEPVLREALAIRRRLGTHRDTAVALETLANHWMRRSEIDAAEPLYRECLAMRRELFEPTNPAIAVALSRLADVQERRGELAEAERLLRESQEVWASSELRDHPDVATQELRLGRVLRARGSLAEAETALRRALALRATVFPPAHAKQLEVREDLVQVLLDAERWEAAEELVLETRAACVERFPATAIVLASLDLQLGAARGGQGRFEEALALLLPAWERIAAHPRLWSQTKWQAAERVRRLYVAQGRTAEAEAWRATRDEHDRHGF